MQFANHYVQFKRNMYTWSWNDQCWIFKCDSQATGEVTIHVQQNKLERYVYKNVDFVVGQ
jgi:hypothetical protein